MIEEKQSKQYSEEDKIWHILTKTVNGKLSILKELDAPTARQIYRSLKPEEYPKHYINAPEERGFIYSSKSYKSSDISEVTVLGPEGCVLDPWKDIEPIIEDLAPKIAFQKLKNLEIETKKKLVQDKADDLGLLKGLTYQLAHSDFRCSCCKMLRHEGEVSSYITDGLKKTDPSDFFIKKSWNRTGSLWCSSCIPKEAKLDEPLVTKSHKYESVWNSIKRLFR